MAVQYSWSKKDRSTLLTALESQRMTFKSFHVGEKAVLCHKIEVLAAFTAGFFIMATSNIANRTKQTAFAVSFFVYLNFKELLLAIIWSFLLSVVGNSGVAALEGSKSIKIRQCNENLAVVDEWPLFRGAVIQWFHCTLITLLGRRSSCTLITLLGRRLNSTWITLLFG